jgi:hypothetical protein
MLAETNPSPRIDGNMGFCPCPFDAFLVLLRVIAQFFYISMQTMILFLDYTEL